MQLRNYQEEIKKEIHARWQAGMKNILVQMSTGAGKTVLFANIMSEFAQPSIAIAHRTEIVAQISLALAQYGVVHNIIAPANTVRTISALHLTDIGKNFIHPQAKTFVAGVDTLIRMNAADPIFSRIGLVVQDEAHHVLKKNKWGKAAAMFPRAVGLYPTATPTRADGCGLGDHADGVIHSMIVGPSMRELIDQGFLSDYIPYGPGKTLDLSNVTIGASGDYSPPKLRTAIHKASITGDVVAHYLKYAEGKLGITFAVDIKAATEIAAHYRSQGVPAEVLTSQTPDLLRANIMRKFRNREIMQLVNVDILGEGVDVPGIEVVSLARPTLSFSKNAQMVGRALRPLAGKTHAIILDHVGNLKRHNLPDEPRVWTLDRRDRKTKSVFAGIPLKTCFNAACLGIYKRTLKSCPYCSQRNTPEGRATIEQVDGDLIRLEKKAREKLYTEIERVDAVPRIPRNVDWMVERSIVRKHTARYETQLDLREAIAHWAGYLKYIKKTDSEIYKIFYFKFGMDIATAQTLGVTDANNLKERIEYEIGLMGQSVEYTTPSHQRIARDF